MTRGRQVGGDGGGEDKKERITMATTNKGINVNMAKKKKKMKVY